ncbi:MAG TPA: peptidoglycan-associated lipoprotein Pal [Candidatus Polarisedimenticolia bacterium]|nr:peptidoglycan-associated lipoprotein Pal [Candidatus Polarisedimenticolia bacterium]
MVHGPRRSLLVAALVLAACGWIVACKSTPTVEPPVSAPPSFESTPKAAEKVEETTGFKEAAPQVESVSESAASQAEKLNAQGVLKRIHFDFDKYDLRTDALRALDDNLAQIKQHAQFKIRIEGHCDERGTVEYNLALGEKRARAARDYFTSKGIPAKRLGIISYGKERPLDPGHNEEAWSQNRRDEFLFLAE